MNRKETQCHLYSPPAVTSDLCDCPNEALYRLLPIMVQYSELRATVTE